MDDYIRVAIAGVGNSCSGLVQGLSFYASGNPQDAPGLTHHTLGGYTPRSIRIVAAFDVDRRKVGRDISEAIFAQPNNYEKHVDVPSLGVTVHMPPLLPEGDKLASVIEVADKPAVDVASILRETKAEILLNLLPTGANQASRFYADRALETGCALINATPAPLVCDEELSSRFAARSLPLVGDDVMSQVGGTILHRQILEFLVERGVRVTKSYQLDVGGGTETITVLNPSHRKLKRAIKANTIKSTLPYTADVVTAGTDYVDFLKDSRDSYFSIAGRYFLDTPVEIDIRLKTYDASNSAGILIDALRAVKMALNRRVGGVLLSVCNYGFKRTPSVLRGERITTAEAHRQFLEFVDGGRKS